MSEYDLVIRNGTVATAAECQSVVAAMGPEYMTEAIEDVAAASHRLSGRPVP